MKVKNSFNNKLIPEGFPPHQLITSGFMKTEHFQSSYQGVVGIVSEFIQSHLKNVTFSELIQTKVTD